MILESGKLKVEFIQSAFSRTRYDNTGLIRQVWLHTDGGDVPFCTVQNLIPGFSSDGAGLANEFNIEDPLYDEKEYDFAFHQIESCCKIILSRI